MKTDILTKFTNKKKMWITPKHPFFFETMEFKILYSTGILMQAAMNKSISTLNNFELQRLLMKGLGLKEKEIAKVINAAKEGNQILGDILEQLNDKVKKSMFLLDLMTVSMSNESEVSKDETQAIHLFAQMLDISEKEENILKDFAKDAYHLNINACISDFEKIRKEKIDLTMTELKYFIPEIEYVTKIESKVIKKGSVLRLVDNCEIRQNIIVPAQTTLTIDNAELRMYGSIVVDGGKLIIRDSRIINNDEKNDSVILVKNYSEVEIYNSILDCNSMGTVLNQKNGNLILVDCKIFHTSKNSAIRFWGDQVNIEHTTFNHCFTPENGAAVQIENGRGLIRNCSFANCEAKKGGAIYTCSDEIMIEGCNFRACRVLRLGAAVYYKGEIKSNITRCEFYGCIPENEEVIQHIGSQGKEKEISKEFEIKTATVLEGIIHITSMGILDINHTVLYLNNSILCDGILNIRNSKVISLNLKERDMFIFHNAKDVRVENSEFDGRQKTGVFRASGTRLTIKHSLFRNTCNGRAVYDAFEPNISDCIFTYCMGGAIYSCSGQINNCCFINCRDRTGAGISMYGARGMVRECTFTRCVSEYSGGAVDLTRGNKEEDCVYNECNDN